MRPAWVNRYIDLPFKDKGRDRTGVDCWGLCRLIFQEQYGIALPAYTEDYKTTVDEQEIAALVRREQLSGYPQLTLAEAKEGDVILFRLNGLPIHVGVVVDPPAFLHVHLGLNVCVERWDSVKWRNRLLAVYRHPARAAQGAA